MIKEALSSYFCYVYPPFLQSISLTPPIRIHLYFHVPFFRQTILTMLIPLTPNNILIYNNISLFCMLNERPEYFRICHSKSVYLNQSKPILLYITSGMSVWTKFLYKKGIKMALMNCLNASTVATLGGDGKYSDGAGLLLHKRKDGGLNGFIVILFTGGAVQWAWGA